MMCGRFVLISSWETIAEEFSITAGDSLLIQQGDIYPGSSTACIVQEGADRRLASMHWGLSPPWVKQKSASKLLINARAETLAEKPAFRTAFLKRRCLIVADGFYEWTKEKKQYCFSLKSKKPFGLAGIIESEINSIAAKVSFTIITTQANSLVAAVHNRMPVIICADKKETWLCDDTGNHAALKSLLVPYPAAQMEMHPL